MMADIDVVPKSRTKTWLWILVALVILAALLMVVIAGRADASTMPGQSDRTIQAPASAVVLV
jgi:hypothetical protein